MARQPAASIRIAVFRDTEHWGDDLFVISEYAIGIEAGVRDLVLSAEHSAARWLPFAAGSSLLRFDGDRTALLELNQRLRGLGPRA